MFCSRCGAAAADGDHPACDLALTLEPPRYCVTCRRRLIVQVLPTGFTARCSTCGHV
jgi:hypothetical protein